jgi:hypothetical protein
MQIPHFVRDDNPRDTVPVGMTISNGMTISVMTGLLRADN